MRARRLRRLLTVAAGERASGMLPAAAVQQRQPPFQRSPSGSGGGGRGRGYAGSPGPGVNQSAAFACSGGGAAGGKLFGRGPEAVAYDRDKEKGLWKQSPAATSEGQLQGHLAPAGRPPVTVERLVMQERPPVTAERLPEAGSSSGGPGNAAEGGSDALAGLDTAATVAQADEMEAAPVEAATEAAAEAEAAVPGLAGDAEEGLSRASSGGSDLGWAGVLGAAAAAAATSPGGSPSASFGSIGGSTSGQDGSADAAASDACGDGSPGEAAGSQHRHWWPLSPPCLAALQTVPVARNGTAAEAAAAAAGGSSAGPAVQLSIRLERQALTDPEAAMLADWCCQHRGSADVLKLWLFDNRLADGGAEAVARILAAHPRMQEVHLSHNMLTLRGAAALLEALPVGTPAAEGAAAEAQAEAPAPAAELPSRPCWLRMEWNRISLEGLMQARAAGHARRGLVVDLPSAVRADATPNLPDLPPSLAAAAAAAPAPPTPVPASRGSRNTLQYQVERCHARMPWVSCQYQLPSEAAVLKVARRGWQAQQAQQATSAASSQASTATNVPRPPPPPPRPAPAPAAAAAAEAAAGAAAPAAAQQAAAGHQEAVAGPQEAVAGTAGPLLLFPDTSALLPMLGAGAGVSLPTFFTLDMLGRLAQQGRFGRALPPHEQVFLVVTDSVLKQLDGLKNDPAARAVVRRFLGQGLDAYGPAGADFLTVLGAHEGEGLLVEHDAAVAGSADASVGTKGQRADHRIVEVALFFQREILRGTGAGPAADARKAAGGPAEADEARAPGSGAGGSSDPAATCASPAASPAALPVLLLSGDNAQVLTARAHGLPAARMSQLAAAQAALEAALEQGQGQGRLGASLLRSLLGGAATAGLGTTAGRSLQAEFDEAISVLAAAADALAASQARLEAAAAAAGAEAPDQDSSAALQAVRSVLAGQEGGVSDARVLLPALRSRLGEWQARVKSHQDPSRLLRWAASS
ncbi:hypothetical protein ABPG75_011439 [Micractinium tetrahymenae]